MNEEGIRSTALELLLRGSGYVLRPPSAVEDYRLYFLEVAVVVVVAAATVLVEVVIVVVVAAVVVVIVVVVIVVVVEKKKKKKKKKKKRKEKKSLNLLFKQNVTFQVSCLHGSQLN
ncbi:LOW QUALITY PROTEIN: hypothetical protein ElyMa_004774100 [Elysia marginata]|uniref:Uncharacterized protein n=1 Tax=Elysia marginata TaxID=1093978 RepID=A0AAV4IK25_9GAST|nr:LOW QUALITY PROTEIN: hypothetical protein ElyMa_004774100 [Elysia marginata]